MAQEEEPVFNKKQIDKISLMIHLNFYKMAALWISLLGAGGYFVIDNAAERATQTAIAKKVIKDESFVSILNNFIEENEFDSALGSGGGMIRIKNIQILWEHNKKLKVRFQDDESIEELKRGENYKNHLHTREIKFSFQESFIEKPTFISSINSDNGKYGFVMIDEILTEKDYKGYAHILPFDDELRDAKPKDYPEGKNFKTTFSYIAIGRWKENSN